MRIVAPAEGNMLSIKGEQAMIRDCNAVSVTAEIPQHLQRSSECRLDVHHPVLTAQTAHHVGKLLVVAEHGCRCGADDLLAAILSFQSIDQLAANDTP